MPDAGGGDVEAELYVDIDGSQPALLENLFTLLLVLRVEAELGCPAEKVRPVAGGALSSAERKYSSSRPLRSPA